MKLQLACGYLTIRAIRFLHQHGVKVDELNLEELEQKTEDLDKLVAGKIKTFGYDVKTLCAETDLDDVKRKMLMFDPKSIKLELSRIEKFKKERKELMENDRILQEFAKNIKEHPFCQSHCVTIDKCIYTHGGLWIFWNFCCGVYLVSLIV